MVETENTTFSGESESETFYFFIIEKRHLSI